MPLVVLSHKRKKPKKYSRGYEEVTRRILSKPSKFNMSCFNCQFFYQGVGDETEVCQNPSVLKYDMIITDNNIYCRFWKLIKKTNKNKGLFKKGTKI